MDLVKRFLKYVSFDTQSDDNSTATPSTSKQLLLAKYLVKKIDQELVLVIDEEGEDLDEEK